MRPVHSHLVVRGRLLPQAHAVPSLHLPAAMQRQLLPQAVSILLLASASTILSLSARQRHNGTLMLEVIRLHVDSPNPGGRT